MNLYEISATLENGAVHKTKIYEINQATGLPSSLCSLTPPAARRKRCS